MTWQVLFSVLGARHGAGAESPAAEPLSAVFSCRCDAGFGLPLLGALWSQRDFDDASDDMNEHE
jgi:hypothetical protein